MAKKGLKRGLFITLEGAEGCGKTTHAKLLYEHLLRGCFDCILTREPGGTKLGESIRNILLHSDGVRISDLAELFLFEAARAQIAEEIIKPNLSDNKIVICDRFYDATLAYQGYAGGVPLKLIESLNMASTGGLKPDITILLDVDTIIGLKRAGQKGADRMENKAIEYHKKVRRGYLELAKKEPSRFRIIKVSGTINQTQRLIQERVKEALQKHRR